MHYECSCGFVADSATQFYKHLAASKESGAGHQLTQARFGDRQSKNNSSGSFAQQTGGPSPPASWVDEYLMVDQPEPGAKPQPSAPPQLLPISTGAHQSAGVPQQQGRTAASGAATELEAVPLRDMTASTKSWSSSRQRPPLPSLSTSTSLKRAAAAATGEPRPSLVDIDEVELVEPVHGGRTRRTSGSGAAGGLAGASSGGVQGGAAQAALRMSGTVISAMAVGLSPWRWFGQSGGDGGSSCGVGGAGGPAAGEELVGDLAFVGGAAGEDSGRALLRRARTSLSGADNPPIPAGDVQEPPVASLAAIHAVRNVFIWRNPWHTGRIFGAGLYLAVCFRQLMKGHDLLQPSTALFCLAFLLLLRNVVREAMASYRRSQAQAQAAVEEVGQGELQEPSPRDDSAERKQAAMLMQQRVEAILRPIALGVAHYGAALVVLGMGLLSGRRAITSALVAALLWLGMVVGELRVMSQPMFWLVCYVALFTIPAAYYRCRHAMDAGVEAVLRFVVGVLVSGSRTSLLAAGGVVLVVVAALPLNFVLRTSIAGVAGFAVLLWQSDAIRQGPGAAAGRGSEGGQAARLGVEGAGGPGGHARLLPAHQHRE